MRDVLVVGAGPVGLFLTLSLRRAGLDVLLLDQREGPGFDPRAAVIWPRTASLLAERGLGPAFSAECGELSGVQLFVRGEPRGELKLRGLDGPAPLPWIIEQHATERILSSVVGQVQRGTVFERLEQDQDGVTATTSAGVFRARYLVACDGAHSTVRKALGLRFTGSAHPGLTCLQANATVAWASPPPPGFCRFDLSPGATLLSVPLPGEGYRLVSFSRDEDPRPPAAPTLDETERALSSIVGAPLQLGLTEPKWHVRARFQDRIAERLCVGRVVLCGDAAAVWAPIGGRGMNVGLIAAAHLAGSLTNMLLHGASPELLTAYEQQVRAVVSRIISTLHWNRTEYPSTAATLRVLDVFLRTARRQQVVPRFIERMLSLHQLPIRTAPAQAVTRPSPPTT